MRRSARTLCANPHYDLILALVLLDREPYCESISKMIVTPNLTLTVILAFTFTRTSIRGRGRGRVIVRVMVMLSHD